MTAVYFEQEKLCPPPLFLSAGRLEKVKQCLNYEGGPHFPPLKYGEEVGFWA